MVCGPQSKSVPCICVFEQFYKERVFPPQPQKANLAACLRHGAPLASAASSGMSAFARFHSAPVGRWAAGASGRCHSAPPALWHAEVEPELEIIPMLIPAAPPQEPEDEEPEPIPPIQELAALRMEEVQPEPEELEDAPMLQEQVAPAPPVILRPATPTPNKRPCSAPPLAGEEVQVHGSTAKAAPPPAPKEAPTAASRATTTAPQRSAGHRQAAAPIRAKASPLSGQVPAPTAIAAEQVQAP